MLSHSQVSPTTGGGVAALEAAFQWFIQEVSKIPAVKQVFLSPEGYGATLFTVLDREPKNEQVRFQVYELEWELLGKLPDDILIDLRLINLAEFDNPDVLGLPKPESLIYQRE